MSGFSMMGSGIYVEDIHTNFECADCEKEFELDGHTNDWQDEASAECPECGVVLTKSLEKAEPDYEPVEYPD
jgi:DNA-directed RNA polymerase subunit RPC12/RpoP